MPIVNQKRKTVYIESYNLGRFAVECAKAEHRMLTFQAGLITPTEFMVASGVPFAVASDIAKRLPSRRDESKSDKPDPDVDAEGKTPEDGGERK